MKNDHDTQGHPKVFDVMRPGRAMAHPSSRPTVVGHVPQVQDTMFGGTPGRFASAHEEEHLLESKQRLQLEPTSAPDLPAAQTPAPAAEPAAEPAAPDPDPTPAPTPTPSVPIATADLDDDPLLKPLPSDEPQIPEKVVTAWPVAEAPSAPETPSKDHWIAAAEKEVEPNTHPLLHGDGVTVVHHKNKHKALVSILLTIIVLIVLGAIAGNFLLDANIISNGYDLPHTNVLTDKQ